MTAPQPKELKIAVQARAFFSSYKIIKKTGCWEWQGCRNQYQYGQVRARLISDENSLAHRLMWDIVKGPVPKGIRVLHHCDNPPCVNPDHLFLGTAKDNSDDMVRKKRHRSFRPGKYMPSGKDHPMYNIGVKITRVIAMKIKTAKGMYKDIAARFDVDPSLVSRIKNGHCWK